MLSPGRGGVSESNAYRSILMASQASTWLFGRLLKARFNVELSRPPGLLERGSQTRLILAPLHRSVLDPWLIMGALEFRRWRTLVPVRTLATQTFGGVMKWFGPLIRIVYRVEGVIELPPREEGGTIGEKLRAVVDALHAGDVVAIFPEGGIWRADSPPLGEFAPGVVYLQRCSGADIVPIAIWKGRRTWRRRRRYVIEMGSPVQIPTSLTLEDGARWLRERTMELYERAKARGEAAA